MERKQITKDVVFEGNLVQKLALAISFAALTGISSKIKFFLPFTPVPITMQTLIVLSSGYFLGKRFGAYSQAIYILFGLLGIDWFAYKGGLHTLIGPTGGYLIGFVIASYIVGNLTEKQKRIFISLILGNIAIYVMGGLWLWGFLGFCDIKTVFLKGIAPFIIGDFIKIIVATGIIKLYQKAKNTT
jgi:biotin transport system substrate-specific component